MKPSSSQDNNNRRQESNLPGHCSKSQSSTSDNFGKNQESGRTLGQSRARQKRRQTSGRTIKYPTTREYRRSSRISDPVTRAEIPEYVGWEKLSQLTQEQLERFSDNFGTSHLRQLASKVSSITEYSS